MSQDDTRIHNYVPMVYGVPADVYRRVLQAERKALYATRERCKTLYRLYRNGLFSAGRPGIIAGELQGGR